MGTGLGGGTVSVSLGCHDRADNGEWLNSARADGFDGKVVEPCCLQFLLTYLTLFYLTLQLSDPTWNASSFNRSRCVRVIVKHKTIF